MFDLDIVKNFAFDKKENPYKFELKAIEPTASNDSAFTIEPRKCIIGSRSTNTFTVTFDPMKGAGHFRSIVLAAPELTQTEVEVHTLVEGQAPKEELTKKGSLGIISLNLEADTIEPQLSIDRKRKMDGQNHVRIKYWSVQGEGAPKKVQKLTFTNNSKADLTFNLNVNGPFQIVKTKTNSGASHPLSGKTEENDQSLVETQKSGSKVIQPKVETMFCLQPLKIVDVHVKFLVPTASDNSEWPMTIMNERKGELVAFFNNGDQ